MQPALGWKAHKLSAPHAENRYGAVRQATTTVTPPMPTPTTDQPAGSQMPISSCLFVATSFFPTYGASNAAHCWRPAAGVAWALSISTLAVAQPTANMPSIPKMMVSRFIVADHIRAGKRRVPFARRKPWVTLRGMTDQGIKTQIDAAFRKARLERDEPTKLVIGMLKSKVLLELKSGSGAVENDELWLRVVAAYAKQVRKTIGELEPLGAQAAEALAEARFELEFCERFLPKKLDAAATEDLVRKLAADNGITDKKQMGKLMGLIMKNHKDDVDGDLARAAAESVLS
jgi:uncharacterized protein YqeY